MPRRGAGVLRTFQSELSESPRARRISEVASVTRSGITVIRKIISVIADMSAHERVTSWFGAFTIRVRLPSKLSQADRQSGPRFRSRIENVAHELAGGCPIP